MMEKEILIIGGGTAGMSAALLLAESGSKVFLLEKSSMIGGAPIKFEEVFPNMECSTCMMAPIQQEVLQSDNIELITGGTLESLEGSEWDFRSKISAEPKFVSPEDCIGCGACYDPCPVSVPNEFEQGMAERKAIYVPCAGALPNVPTIDRETCLRFTKGEDCTLCVEACMFEAIDFEAEPVERELSVDSVILAAGFDEFELSDLDNLGVGENPAVYTAMEFERLFASNGPTEGELELRSGRDIEKAIIIHCGGREQVGYCSGICCLNNIKLARFIHHQRPEAKITHLYRDLCLPGKRAEKFYRKTMETGVEFLRSSNIKVTPGEGGSATVNFDSTGEEKSLTADIVIVSPAVVPPKSLGGLSEKLGIALDEFGFVTSGEAGTTSRPGVFAAGCVLGPRDIAASVSSAESAVGRALSPQKSAAEAPGR